MGRGDIRIEPDEDLTKAFYEVKGEITGYLGEDAINRQVLRALLKVWKDTPQQARRQAIVGIGPLHARSG